MSTEEQEDRRAKDPSLDWMISVGDGIVWLFFALGVLSLLVGSGIALYRYFSH